MKATSIAPSNIAFTKYWGKKDELLRLPENGSISMCLSDLLTTTTVEFSDKYTQDEVTINGEVEAGEETRAIKHLDRVRKLAGISTFAKVVSNNNFPKGTGLSSSASGFAALTLAAAKAAGLNLNEKQLSILARQGSGSACRSIPSGFVEWQDGDTTETSYAKTIFPANHWNIVDVVAIVSQGRKDVSTSEGMKTLGTSPFVKTRVEGMKEKNKLAKKYLKEKNFSALGDLAEREALEMHAIMITQNPPLIYFQPNTILMMKLVQKWRQEGLESYFTINTGQDVHVLVQMKDHNKLIKKLQEIPEVRNIIPNKPSQGAKLSIKHLF
jgi:diphosphomevalonate decarboxylase